MVLLNSILINLDELNLFRKIRFFFYTDLAIKKQVENKIIIKIPLFKIHKNKTVLQIYKNAS
jgi:hypothetical protein